jgi:hypothetical protein
MIDDIHLFILFIGVDFREKTLEIDNEIFKVCRQIKMYPNSFVSSSIASNMGYSWTR